MSNLTFAPINDWIVVKEEVAAETVSASGIIMPKIVSSKQKIKKCTVVAVSEDVAGIAAAEGREIQYKVGDHILHYSETGIPLDVGDKNNRTLFLKWDAVIAVCNSEKNDE